MVTIAMGTAVDTSLVKFSLFLCFLSVCMSTALVNSQAHNVQPYFIEEMEMAEWVPEGCEDGRKMGRAERQSVGMVGKWAPGI